MAKHKRKLRNYLIRPVSQLKISGSMAASVFAIVVVLNVMNYFRYLNITEVMTDYYGLNDELREIFLGIRMQLFVTDIISTTFFLIIAIFLWIKFTHPIYGAIVGIKRGIRLLIEGEYERKVTLRKKDEFKDVAALLNELGSVLQKRHSLATDEMK